MTPLKEPEDNDLGKDGNDLGKDGNDLGNVHWTMIGQCLICTKGSRRLLARACNTTGRMHVSVVAVIIVSDRVMKQKKCHACQKNDQLFCTGVLCHRVN